MTQPAVLKSTSVPSSRADLFGDSNAPAPAAPPEERWHWVSQTTWNSSRALVQQCSSFSTPVADLSLSYLFSVTIAIPLNLEQAAKLEELHFTAEDLTRLCNGSYCLVGVTDHAFLKNALADEGMGVDYALNLNPHKARGKHRRTPNELEKDIGFFRWIEQGSLPDAIKRFEFVVDQHILLTRAFTVAKVAQVVENGRLALLRCGNNVQPDLQKTGNLLRNSSRQVGTYREEHLPAENIKPIALVVEGDLPKNNKDNPFLSEKWRGVLAAQYRTCLIRMIREDRSDFFKDWVQGTQGEQERNSFVAKYLAAYSL